ncbi:helix-turn-helix domain-containing protein [Trinickia fusca]|uniref:Transcriptional regulator n=1 Tax=Trinickia fusca TaxID=2419777 RepID=A0A494X9S9_9BURK|nr:helix-turn-helix domain-containing protein [Trinickia fusca]RKP47527.1 transcriptional regulator [Trinickia fusca]
MPYSRQALRSRRAVLERDWASYGRAPVQASLPAAVGSDVLHSWRRSFAQVPDSRRAAPVDEAAESSWLASPLRRAASPLLDELSQLAEEGGLVAAIGDETGRLLWTSAARPMLRRAAQVHFVPGGRWDEASIGTNALSMALGQQRPVTVFSAEHYVETVHDWVCYAAPIADPTSGCIAGVVDLSTTWDKHNPLGLAAAASFAQRIAALLPQLAAQAELELCVLGEPVVRFRGRRLKLTRRHVEILCLLAMAPEGLSLDALHAQLYGDASVSLGTLKAEISHLRRELAGAIDSRPYRLTVPVKADFLAVEDALGRGSFDDALSTYPALLLPCSQAPAISERRHFIEAGIVKAVWNCVDAETLWRYASRVDDSSALERLLALLPRDDPRRPLLTRRLAEG